jgi:hypothetical protein
MNFEFFIGPRLPQDWMESEFVWLSERIILAKLLYYTPEKMTEKAHRMEVPDEAYDDFELAYLRLCRELQAPNTLVHKEYLAYENIPGTPMFEVDFNREDVKLILEKWGKK